MRPCHANRHVLRAFLLQSDYCRVVTIRQSPRLCSENGVRWIVLNYSFRKDDDRANYTIDPKYGRKVERAWKVNRCFSPPVGICCLYRRGEINAFLFSPSPRFPAASVYAKAKRRREKRRQR